MKKAIKKIAVTVFTTASLSALMVGMNANASSATVTDSYTKFYYYRGTTSATCTLTNTSGSSRYAQAAMTVYLLDSSTKYTAKENNSLSSGSSVTTSYDGSSTITGVEYRGTLYTSTTATGDPLSAWRKTL